MLQDVPYRKCCVSNRLPFCPRKWPFVEDLLCPCWHILWAGAKWMKEVSPCLRGAQQCLVAMTWVKMKFLLYCGVCTDKGWTKSQRRQWKDWWTQQDASLIYLFDDSLYFIWGRDYSQCNWELESVPLGVSPVKPESNAHFGQIIFLGILVFLNL